jgi:hypothetical protein
VATLRTPGNPLWLLLLGVLVFAASCQHKESAPAGTVTRIPFTICCWESTDDRFEPVAFRVDSSLVVFTGLRDEKEDDVGAHGYRFENGSFVEIHANR